MVAKMNLARLPQRWYEELYSPSLRETTITDYICIDIYMYIYTHTHTHTYVCVYMYICKRTL